MIIEMLCETPDDLKQALLTQTPVKYLYLKVNRKPASMLTFSETKARIYVAYFDEIKHKHIAISFIPPGTNMQTTFNKRRTKVTIRVTGTNRTVTEL